MLFTNLHRQSSATQRISSPPKLAFEFAFSHDLGHDSSEEDFPQEHRNSVSTETNSSEGSFTKKLLESHPAEFRAATEAPFLRVAGAGKVDKALLSRWLAQDRLYAETYICFISSLIARVNLPYAYVNDKSKSLRWKLVEMLNGALQNILKEIEFFTSTAQKYGLELEAPPSEESDLFGPAKATKQYMDLFRSFFLEPSTSLLEGLVVLWGTEQCYLSAWTHASKQASGNTSTKGDSDGGALREAFIPNWTASEFKDFVDHIAELTDALADRENAARKFEVYKAVWLHILDIERRFWPQIED